MVHCSLSVLCDDGVQAVDFREGATVYKFTTVLKLKMPRVRHSFRVSEFPIFGVRICFAEFQFKTHPKKGHIRLVCSLHDPSLLGPVIR